MVQIVNGDQAAGEDDRDDPEDVEPRYRKRQFAAALCGLRHCRLLVSESWECAVTWRFTAYALVVLARHGIVAYPPRLLEDSCVNQHDLK